MKNKSMYVFLFMMLGLFAGMASPIQTSINSELRNAIHSPFIASLISFWWECSFFFFLHRSLSIGGYF